MGCTISLLAVARSILFILAQSSLPIPQEQEFRIQKIEPKLISTPEYHYTGGPSLNLQNKKRTPFLALEVAFSYQPVRESEENLYIEDVLFTYYLLLNTRTQKYSQRILLTGSVLHTAIRARGEKYSVMYMVPSTLDRFFLSHVPVGVSQIVYDVGVVISKGEKLLALKSWKGRGEWWKNYPQVSGWLLNKNQTPFAPLWWDAYEQIQTSQ